MFEVRGEETLANLRTDLFRGEEPTTVEFVLGRMNLAIIGATVDIDQFAFALASEDIMVDFLRLEIGDAEFFANLTVEGLGDVLAQVYMSAAGRIPFVGLDILPCRTMLEIEFTTAVEQMEMNDGVEDMRSVVSMSTAHGSENVSRFIDNGKLFVLIIFHCVLAV